MSPVCKRIKKYSKDKQANAHREEPGIGTRESYCPDKSLTCCSVQEVPGCVPVNMARVPTVSFCVLDTCDISRTDTGTDSVKSSRF